MISHGNNWYNLYKLAFRNKLDLFSKKLAKDVFDNFIRSNETRGKFQYIINAEQETDLNSYSIKEMVFVIDLYAVSFDVIGHYLPDQKTIVIDIKLNPKILLRDYQNPTKSEILTEAYERIIQETKYTIRHELEHAYYDTLYDYAQPSYNMDTKWNNYLQYAFLAQQYLLDPSEIDSYIRELMLKAKNKRIPMDALLVEMVNKKITEIAPEIIKKEIQNNTKDGIIYKNIIDEILDVYRKRINFIYQKRK